MKTFKGLWLSVIVFSILELLAILILVKVTDHASDVVTGVLVITFIIYPLFFLISFFLLPKVKRKVGSLIMLTPIAISLVTVIVNP